MSSRVYYRVDSNVPWERLPKFSWTSASNLTRVKKSDHLNHRILLETIFQALSCGRARFKKSYVESCDYVIDVLVDFVCNAKHDDAQLGAVALHVGTMVQFHFEERFSTHAETQRISDNLLFNRKIQIWIVLTTLPRRYPEAAQVTLSNGRLPLHWALEAGKIWDGPATRDDIHNIAIEVLVEAYPKSVTVIDPVTGLLPFMMAAANDQSSSVNTTFELLRMMDPTMLLMGTLRGLVHSNLKASKKRMRAKKKGR